MEDGEMKPDMSSSDESDMACVASADERIRIVPLAIEKDHDPANSGSKMRGP